LNMYRNGHKQNAYGILKDGKAKIGKAGNMLNMTSSIKKDVTMISYPYLIAPRAAEGSRWACFIRDGNSSTMRTGTVFSV